MIYFDFAATCPLDSDAAETYIQAASNYFGNASSLHDTGEKARSLLEMCRSELSRIMNVPVEGIFFTSGGTESNYLAIESLVKAANKSGKHLITGVAEHSSVHSVMARLEKEGYEITYLPFNARGIIDIDSLNNSIRDDTILISIQHGNSEIGTIQPLEQISKLCKKHDIFLHTDCVQTFGKSNMNQVSSLVDSLSISGHKVYGPKGIGAVFIKPNIQWKQVFPGATHEKGFRAGTVNVPAIASMITAIQKNEIHMEEQNTKFDSLRRRFIQTLNPIETFLTIHGAKGNEQISSIIGLSVEGIEGQWLMLECNRRGFAISTGTACHTGMMNSSKTMQALGFVGKTAKEFIRISFGRISTLQEVELLGNAIVQIVESKKSTDKLN
jgi:cysteine desulfurase